jgi:hypothetical protein
MESDTKKKKKLPKDYSEDELKELGIFIKSNEYEIDEKKESQ